MDVNHSDIHLLSQEQSHELLARFSFPVVTFIDRNVGGSDEILLLKRLISGILAISSQSSTSSTPL